MDESKTTRRKTLTNVGLEPAQRKALAAMTEQTGASLAFLVRKAVQALIEGRIIETKDAA